MSPFSLGIPLRLRAFVAIFTIGLVLVHGNHKIGLVLIHEIQKIGLVLIQKNLKNRCISL